MLTRRSRTVLLSSLLVVVLLFVAGAPGASGDAAAPDWPGQDDRCTPVPTPTSDAKWAYGRVIDEADGRGLSGVTVRLYRSAGSGWDLVREKLTDAQGRFGFSVRPPDSGYRLVEVDPPYYRSVSAELPPSVEGTVVDANTITFSLPDSGLVGEFLFRDCYDPQAGPTAGPSPTATEVTKWVYGTVIDRGAGGGLAGAVVRLYREVRGKFVLLREATTGPDGDFGFGISPVLTQYRLVETDPPDYMSYAAYLPAEVEGEVTDENTITFALPETVGVGEFVFEDICEVCRSTNTPTMTPTATSTPTPTSTNTPTPTATATDTSTPVPTVPSPTATPTDTATVTPTATPTPTATDTPTGTPVPSATPTPRPTATRPPLIICENAAPGLPVYRIEASQFRPYESDIAAHAVLIHVSSPPAPEGWNQPWYQPGDGWEPGQALWWDAWGDYFDPDPPEPIMIGLLHKDGKPRGVDGTTYLMRYSFELAPPEPWMRVISCYLQGWSDNKAAWYWDGALVNDNREGYVGEVELFPDHVRPEGGTYLLAIQNSNDFQYIENPHGTSFRLCVTWAYGQVLIHVDYVPMILK